MENRLRVALDGLDGVYNERDDKKLSYVSRSFHVREQKARARGAVGKKFILIFNCTNSNETFELSGFRHLAFVGIVNPRVRIIQ